MKSSTHCTNIKHEQTTLRITDNQQRTNEGQQTEHQQQTLNK